MIKQVIQDFDLRLDINQPVDISTDIHPFSKLSLEFKSFVILSVFQSDCDAEPVYS